MNACRYAAPKFTNHLKSQGSLLRMPDNTTQLTLVEKEESTAKISLSDQGKKESRLFFHLRVQRSSDFLSFSSPSLSGWSVKKCPKKWIPCPEWSYSSSDWTFEWKKFFDIFSLREKSPSFCPRPPRCDRHYWQIWVMVSACDIMIPRSWTRE